MSATIEPIMEYIKEDDKIEGRKFKTELLGFEIKNMLDFHRCSGRDFLIKSEEGRNYDYVDINVFSQRSELVDIIVKSTEKWLIFVDNKEYGKRLKKELIESVSNMEVEDSIYVSFITSDYTEDYEMFTQVIQITDTNKTLAKVLIATSVLDNGVNIKDINLRNLVIITDTETEFIQMLGRKRYDDSRVKLYLYKHTRDHFVKRQRQNSKRLEIAQSNYEYIYNNIKNILNSIKDKKIVDKWEETAVINQSKFLMNCLMDGNIKFEDMKTLFMGMNGLWILNVLSYQNLENLNQYYNQILEEFQNYGEDAFLKMQIRWLNKEEEEPEELENEDTEESTILEHKDSMESIKAARDVIKIQKRSSAFGVKFVLLGIENQEHIHYAMPMRVMGYDYATYKKQYDSNAKKYKDRNEKEMDDDEFLSKMKKQINFYQSLRLLCTMEKSLGMEQKHFMKC